MKKILFLLILWLISISLQAQSTQINSTGALIEFNSGDVGYTVTNQDSIGYVANGNWNIRSHEFNQPNQPTRRLLLDNPLNLNVNPFIYFIHQDNASAGFSSTIRFRVLRRIGNTIDSSIGIVVGSHNYKMGITGIVYTTIELNNLRISNTDYSNIIGISMTQAHTINASKIGIKSIQFGEPNEQNFPRVNDRTYFNDFNAPLRNRVSSFRSAFLNLEQKNGVVSITNSIPRHHTTHCNIDIFKPILIQNAAIVRLKVRSNHGNVTLKSYTSGGHIRVHFSPVLIPTANTWQWITIQTPRYSVREFSRFIMDFEYPTEIELRKIEIDSVSIENIPGTLSQFFPYNHPSIQTIGEFKEIPGQGLVANAAFSTVRVRFFGDHIGIKIKKLPADLLKKWGTEKIYFHSYYDGGRWSRQSFAVGDRDTMIVIDHLMPKVHCFDIVRLNSTGSDPHIFEGVFLDEGDSLVPNNPNHNKNILFIGDGSLEGDVFNFDESLGPNGHLFLNILPTSKYPEWVSERLNMNLVTKYHQFATLHNLPNNPYTNLNRMLSTKFANWDRDTSAWPADFGLYDVVVIDLHRKDALFNTADSNRVELNYRQRVKEAFFLGRAAYPRAQLIITPGELDDTPQNHRLRTDFINGFNDYRTHTNDDRAMGFTPPIIPASEIEARRLNPHHRINGITFADSLLRFIRNSNNLIHGIYWPPNPNPRLRVLRRPIVFRNSTNPEHNSIHSYQVVGHNNQGNINLSTHLNIGLSTSANGPFHNTLSLPSIGGIVYVRYQPVSRSLTNRRLHIMHETDGISTMLPISISNITNSAEELAELIQLYPNPSSGRVKLQIDETIGRFEGIQVINAIGKVVYTENNPNEGSFEMDLGALPKGLYSISIQVSGQLVRKSLVLR